MENLLLNYFKKGNTVDSFKVVCNNHGYSLTLHLAKPKNDLSDYFPGPLATPKSIKHKSPSNIKRDFSRRQSFKSNEQFGMMNNDSSIVSNDIDLAIPKETVSVSVFDGEQHVNETFDINADQMQDDQASGASKTDSDDRLVETDTGVDDKTPYKEEIKSDEKADSVECGHKSKEKEGEKEDINEECKYRENLRNKDRNKNYSKIVHDTRDGVSKVYGMTDDLIISVDEKMKKYQTYAMHDKKSVKLCKDIYELLCRWPNANPQKCEYGMYCLKTLLPDIVKAESKEA